jgi:hypothetical protein
MSFHKAITLKERSKDFKMNRDLKKLNKWVLIALLMSMLLVFIMGAAGQSSGRYQLEAWGGSGIGFGAFVIDTATGETKIVYLNTGMDTEQRAHLGKPFSEIP